MTSAGQSGGDGDYPLKISEIETSLAQLKGAIQGETEYREVYANEISEIETSLAQLKGAIQGETEYREVHANEISEIETRLAQVKKAIQGETKLVHANEAFEKALSLVRGLSDIQARLEVLQTSQVRLRLAALTDIYQDVRAVLLLRDHGSELYTDLDVRNYEDLLKEKRLAFSKGWCLPEFERWG